MPDDAPRRARPPMPFPFLLLMIVAACTGGDDDADAAGGRPALPPGMVRPVGTNADAVPPAVPWDAATPRLTARVTASWPHDTLAYTQGLLVHEGRVLESTGIAGRSDVREVELATGKVVRRTPLPTDQFGEGLALHGGKLYQLTWRSGRGHVYDVRTLQPTGTFAFSGEGWGLAGDGAALWQSDGSSTLRVVDPATFAVQRTVRVTEAGKPVHGLNELEWFDGALWANVYQTRWIARIDPQTGVVTGWLDTSGLLTPAEEAAVQRRGGVPNGIAWDAGRKQLLVTGKLWPRVFALEIR